MVHGCSSSSFLFHYLTDRIGIHLLMNASGAIPIVCGRMVPSRSGMVVWAPHAISSRISNLVITLDGMAGSDTPLLGPPSSEYSYN